MKYFDHHATTPLVSTARDAIRAALDDEAGNPSSVHGAGRRARARLEQARVQLANVLSAQPREIVFTSGGTEAVHTVVRGVGHAARAVRFDPGGHPSLEAACRQLAHERAIPIEPVPIRAGGEVDLEALAQGVGEGTLVALSWVQHETGAIARVRDIAAALAGSGATLVVDAVQALGKVPIDAPASGAVALAFSAHKIGGPTGVGAAWISGDARARGIATGGAQERGLRAGTENLLGVVGFGAAVAALGERLAARARIGAQRDRIERALRAIEDVVINGTDRERVATACHASVRGVAGEELVAALDLEGFAVSSGPACSSGRPGPSSSMRAIYLDEPWRAASALRITLGVETHDDEVDALVATLPRLIERVRAS